MTKIEEVARAIYEGRNGPGARPWAHLSAAHKAPYRTDARAAIEALKNPPEHALDAMNPSGRYASVIIPEAWDDAIDAILSEEE